MDDEILEFFLHGGILLTDDVILYIAKHFLSPQESLYLALSRTSARFNELYLNNRQILDISRCFHISLDAWQNFFHHHNFASALTVFNASSCYWLPAGVLCHSITQMTSLVELSVPDTDIRIFHFPEIFKSCQSLLKLSFSLLDKNLEHYEEGVMEAEAHGWLIQGFRKLTNLKVFALPSDTSHCIEVWLAIFGVLRWCQNCIHLVIDIPFIPYSYENDLTIMDRVNSASQNLLPHLEWLRSLKTLAILRHDHRFVWSDNNHGTAIKFLINTFLIENYWPGESLERFWIEFNSTDNFSEDWISSPAVKSLLLSHPSNMEMLQHNRFRHLEHLSGVDFSDFFPFDGLPCLKYIQGRVSNIQVYNKFCELHPMLEHLHIRVYADDFPVVEANPVLFHGTWKLLHLKKLVYSGNYWPLKNGDFEARIFEACPNIQELHLDVWTTPQDEDEIFETENSIDFFSKIRLKHLNTLTIRKVSLPFGEILGDRVKEQCPKLERLHLTGGYDEYHKASKGSGKHIPFVTQLRDLRLEWNTINLGQVPVLLIDIARQSPLLERLVVDMERNTYGTWDDSGFAIPMEDQIIDAVKEMKHLVLLCLIGFSFSDDIVHRVQQRLTLEVLPLRPALRFYLGESFPDATDPTVPRIHCNEMIHPQSQFYAPPPI